MGNLNHRTGPHPRVALGHVVHIVIVFTLPTESLSALMSKSRDCL